MNNINIKSAIVSVMLMVILSGALYILGVGDIFKIKGEALINILVMALLTGVVSIIKSMGTDAGGYFAGVKVKK